MKNRLLERRSQENDRPGEYRHAFMKDECRSVHSFSFRRLQGKTQILGPEQGDFHRNRLSHSIEVASISRSIASYLKREEYKNKKVRKDLDELFFKISQECDYLLSTISLLHDIGHPPFGHSGEVALNFQMREKGGFEGNAQTLRIVSKLDKFTPVDGLNLTRRSILGLVKYPVSYKKLCAKYPVEIGRNRDIKVEDWRPPKCYYDCDQDIMDWVLSSFNDHDKGEFCKSKTNNDLRTVDHKESKYKSFDCSIMEIADDISNSVHDIEDAIFLGMLKENDIDNNDLKFFCCGDYKAKKNYLKKDLFNCKEQSVRKKAIGHMVHTLIKTIDIDEYKTFDEKLFRYNVKFSNEAQTAVNKLKEIIKDNIYLSQEVGTIVFGGMMTIMQLFDVLISNPKRLLPKDIVEKIEADNSDGYREVCDYIAGMTDEYARRLHDRIYGNSPRSVLEKL